MAHIQGSSVKTAGDSALCDKGGGQMDDTDLIRLLIKLILDLSPKITSAKNFDKPAGAFRNLVDWDVP